MMADPAAQDIFRKLDREVWIVTAGDERERGGLVATFVSPASIVPGMPRVVVGLSHQHFTQKLVERTGHFALHLLAPAQVELVWHFGLQSGRDIAKLAGINCRTADSGAPLLTDALAWLECRVESRFSIGDRSLYLAEVRTAEFPDDLRPMTLHQLLRDAPEDRLAVLRQQMIDDAEKDAALISAWRKQHGGD